MIATETRFVLPAKSVRHRTTLPLLMSTRNPDADAGTHAWNFSPAGATPKHYSGPRARFAIIGVADKNPLESAFPACRQASLLNSPTDRLPAAVITRPRLAIFQPPASHNKFSTSNLARTKAKRNMRIEHSVAEVVKTFAPTPKPKNNENSGTSSATAFLLSRCR